MPQLAAHQTEATGEDLLMTLNLTSNVPAVLNVATDRDEKCER